MSLIRVTSERVNERLKNFNFVFWLKAQQGRLPEIPENVWTQIVNKIIII